MSTFRDALTPEKIAALKAIHAKEQTPGATPVKGATVKVVESVAVRSAAPAPEPVSPATASECAPVATPAILAAWNVASFSPKRFFDTDPAPFEYVIPGLLAKGLCGFLYGEGGTYKSLAALWLVILRACGKVNYGAKWLDRFEIPGVGRSVFFSAEDVEADLHHRVRAIAARILADRPDIPPSIIAHAISENCLIVSREQWVSDGELFFVNEEGKPTDKCPAIKDTVRAFGADLVILETFSRVANVDEIDNKMGARVVGEMENLRDATGATVLTIAHTSKASRGAQTDTHGQNGLRGASALMDNARFGLWFKAQPSHEGRGCFEIQHAKAFRGMRAESFKVSVDYPAFELVEKIAPDVFAQVVEDVRNNPGTKQRDTRKRLGGRTTVVGRAFKEAVDEERIYLKSTKEGYFITEPTAGAAEGVVACNGTNGDEQSPLPPEVSQERLAL